jgi:hypothetical protein
MEPRPFFLRIYPERLVGEAVNQRLPPHRLILEPLISKAAEVVVHQKAAYEFEVPLPRHTVRHRALVLEPSAGLVADWPAFWNAGQWKRGAVSIKIAADQVDWDQLFAVSEYGGIWSSRHQILKGSPSGAISYAEKNANDGFAVFSLTASNGILWLNIWLPASICVGVDEHAKAQCGHFVRAIEQGKFSREIVYDRPPYSEVI